MRVNQRILILCEGVTEYIYAKSLQMDLPRSLQRGISIEIIYQSQNDPKSLALEAKRKARAAQQERNPYNTVWIFFDNDNSPNLSEAFKIIQKEGFKVAYSSICFEHWFILHFESCARPFNNGKEALRYLQKLWPQYHKTKSNAYKELRNRLEQAVSRAVVIMQNQTDDVEIHNKNPYFTVQELINYFEKMKGGDQ